jgi:hypothetical protein
VDFLNNLGYMNVLGQQVASDLAHALETRLSPGTILSRPLFREALISAGLAPLDLRERDALAANDAQTGATLMITGRILRFKNSNTLQIDIAALPGGQSTSSASTDLTLALDTLPLLTTPIDWPRPPIRANSLRRTSEIPRYPRRAERHSGEMSQMHAAPLR